MKSVEFIDGKIRLMDQTLLPFKKEHFVCANAMDAVRAIKEMRVRGAPAIGLVGAWATAIAKNGSEVEAIKNARPTAVDLKHAVEFVVNYGNRLEGAKVWEKRIIDKCRRISENGATLIKDGAKVLTHCNAGPLATGEYGTALGAIIQASKTKKIFAYVDETRPRFQGALTSWELLENKVQHKVITDNSAGSFMKRGMIDAIFVGADRITANGDVANKIGTYSVAVLAKENNIPFYVLAPMSTFDFGIKSGDEIKIEQRNEKEVLEVYGKRIYPNETRAENPAFDVTPAKYVTAYVTEYGVHKKIDEIRDSETYVGVKFQIVHENKKADDNEVAKIVEISEKLSGFFDPKENEGNLSVRYSADNSFLIKKTGSKLTNMKKEDVVLVTRIDNDKVFANGTPSSEARMHYEIYKVRKDVNAILHFHDNDLMKSKIKCKEIGPFEYGTEESAMAAAEALKDGNFIKIREHGFVLIRKDYKDLILSLKEIKNRFI